MIHSLWLSGVFQLLILLISDYLIIFAAEPVQELIRNLNDEKDYLNTFNEYDFSDLSGPSNGWSDSNGNYYIADQTRIRKVSGTTGIMSTILGEEKKGYIGENYPATGNTVDEVTSIWGDSNGNLFYCDTHQNRIRKIFATTNLVNTIVGTGVYGYNGENLTGTSTLLFFAVFITGDSHGNIYYSDQYNHRIRKYIASNMKVVTIAGNGSAIFGGDGMMATSAGLNYPSGIAIDFDGNVYFSDSANHRIRKISIDGIITTTVGNGNSGCNCNDLSGNLVPLVYPQGLWLDLSGNLFWIDNWSLIRSFNVNNSQVSTVIGFDKGVGYDKLDSIFEFNGYGLSGGSDGQLFIADNLNSRILTVFNGTMKVAEWDGFCDSIDRTPLSLSDMIFGNILLGTSAFLILSTVNLAHLLATLVLLDQRHWMIYLES